MRPTDPIEIAVRPEDDATTLVSFHTTVAVTTTRALAVHDLTDAADQFVEECAVGSGVLVAMSLHTTAGLLLNERESGLQADLREIADTLVPRRRSYLHDDMRVRRENLCPEDADAPNGHAHLQHAIFGSPALALPIADGRLVRGRWQRLLLVEYDRPRHREIHLQVLGLSGPRP